jgi:hypothetical protein
MNLKESLSRIVANPDQHALFLNTLSYLENCGAKLIAACEHPTIVPKEMLKHAAEEFRHAYYLKAQIQKIVPYEITTYRTEELLGGFPARHYLYALNTRISAYLIHKRGVRERKLKEFAYLLVTFAIEIRAEGMYPLYQELLKSAGSPVSVISIIREEEQHLEEIRAELKGTEADAWKEDVCQLEENLFHALKMNLCKY